MLGDNQMVSNLAGFSTQKKSLIAMDLFLAFKGRFNTIFGETIHMKKRFCNSNGSGNIEKIDEVF